MGSRPTIRVARTDDAGGVGSIFAHYVLETTASFVTIPPSAEEWQERIIDLSQTGHPFVVAEEGGDVVGFAYAAPWRSKPSYRFAVEDSVYVANEHHGRGIGKLLLEALLTSCRAAGFRTVVAVIAATGSEASRALHLTAGFREVGTLEAIGFKFDRWIDTTLLQLDLRADAGEVPGATR